MTLGFVAIGAYWLAGLWELRLGRVQASPWASGQRRHMAVILQLSLLAGTVTPYGTRLVGYPIHMSLLDPLMFKVVRDWHHLDFHQFYGKWFLFLLLLFFVGQLAARRSYRVVEVTLLLFTLTETFLHARFMLLFVPVFAPLLALLLSEWIPSRSAAKEHYALGLLLSGVACATVFIFLPSHARLQKAVNLWNPTGAVRYLRAHPMKGPMLNFADWGSYLMDTFSPAQEVFMNGRLEGYELRGVLLDYLHIFQGQSNTLFLLRKYHVHSCLIPHDNALASLLATLPGWTRAYKDKTSVLWYKILPSPQKAKEVIRK